MCRDFAHLGITFCRALGIPARFVSAYGYKLYPQDFHAVFEAYLGGRWYLFDPTRLSPPDGLIRIGVGRDAADTAFATYLRGDDGLAQGDLGRRPTTSRPERAVDDRGGQPVGDVAARAAQCGFRTCADSTKVVKRTLWRGNQRHRL